MLFCMHFECHTVPTLKILRSLLILNNKLILNILSNLFSLRVKLLLFKEGGRMYSLLRFKLRFLAMFMKLISTLEIDAP